jgi:hypothetical protein
VKGRSFSISFIVAIYLTLSVRVSLAGDPNQLSEEEREKGFVILFNGRDFRGWKSEGNWRVRDASITCTSRGNNLVYHAITIREPLFELRFEWKVIKQGNELARVVPQFAPPDACFFTEFRVPRTESDVNGHVREWGQLAFFYETGGGMVGMFSQETALSPGAPKGLTFSRGPKMIASRPLGQWNSSRIIWQGKAIQHWLNGEKVVDTELDARSSVPPEARRMLQELQSLASEALKGGIQIQIEDQDSPLLFRGIKLRLPRAGEMQDRAAKK